MLCSFLRVDKNHNPRKGTETGAAVMNNIQWVWNDKNHNPRKGTETLTVFFLLSISSHDKNHNPRKGTETWPGQSMIVNFHGLR